MVGNPLMPGSSSVDQKTGEAMLRAGGTTTIEEIPIVTLDEEIHRAGLPKLPISSKSMSRAGKRKRCAARARR